MAHQDDLAAILARVSQQNAIPLAALMAIVAVLVQSGAALVLDGLEPRLAAKALDFVALRDRLASSSGDPALNDLRKAAARALDAGQFAQADRALAQAELTIFGGTSDLSNMTSGKRLAAASCRSDRGAINFLRLSADACREAAQSYGEAAAIAGTSDLERQRGYALQQLRVLNQCGELFDDKAAFEAAISHSRTQSSGLDNFRDTVAWASVQEQMGLALAGLSRLRDDLSGLKAAASCYRTALEDVRQPMAPALWLRLQMHLGRAALTLGEAADDVDLMEESVEALQAAQKFCKRADDPQIWARLKFELGNALSAVGVRMSGTASLEGAMNAYHDALKVWSRAERPVEWSQINDRIGVALCAMATRYGETLFLEEAIDSFAAALSERKRATQALLWATTSANQAQAMMMLAERKSNRALAEQALGQIMTAMDTLKGAGLPADAKKLEARLIKAGALVEALRKG